MSANQRHDTTAPGASAEASETDLHRTPAQVAKDIALFFAAPFITLAYMPLFAFLGVQMLCNKDSAAWHEWHASDPHEP